jgi:two-component system phosphate regulon sensor histidine kinase PhoR
MLTGLRRRLVAGVVLGWFTGAGFFAFLLFETGLAAATSLAAMVALFGVAALTGFAAAAAWSAPALIDLHRSLARVVQWSRSIRAGAAVEAAPPVGPDLAEAADELRDLARGLQHELNVLQTDRSRLAVALTYMESGVVLVDAHYRVGLVNPAAARMLRTTTAAAEGRTLAEIARDHELVAVATTCLESPPPVDPNVLPIVVEMGEPPRSVQVVATPIAGDGERPGALLLLQDVTLLRRAEVVRREFVANVSHELRTPLAGLKALAETLEAGALEDPPAAREFLGRMLIEVDRLTELVQELLELARLEAGAPGLEHEHVDLADIAEHALERLDRRAEQAGIRLSLQRPPGALLVQGDRTRIERVFVNLVENAIKYTDRGGSIHVDFKREDDQIVAAVHDTGRGIPPEDLPRIFERFYKGDKARSSPGSGLGLAIVKHTVQAHGGRVWTESTEGRGSTFFVSLPAATSER